ncbi:mitochondrial outer membrane protein SLC25A46-like isoform X2 [Amphiura filiformis]|uniref:mitochondrial outer membrane protein SLC25A46-like isoform X2 n=1 Tax=Amphiura filiformis TaxID=82378 RepID=UPI003B219A81
MDPKYVLEEKEVEHVSENMQRFAGFGIGIATLLSENVLCHPFIVFRRQCQVHQQAYRYHLQPFSVVQVIVNLQRHQGSFTMWKGIGSSFVVQGLTLGTEAVISEVTPLCKEVTRFSTLKEVAGHLALKALSIAVTMPFYSASLVESVQSDIASERPGVFDCIKEGLCRLVGWGTPQTTRLLPMYALLLPTVSHGLVKYIFTSGIQYLVQVVFHEAQKLRHQVEEDGNPPPPRSMMEAYFPELLASFLGSLFADVTLYPFETILNRLHIQGTRTIIDNIDYGYSVVPISTRYEGFSDCFRSVVKDEGMLGLYKGFGALILQYAIHAAILKLTHVIYTRLIEDLLVVSKKKEEE